MLEMQPSASLTSADVLVNGVPGRGYPIRRGFLTRDALRIASIERGASWPFNRLFNRLYEFTRLFRLPISVAVLRSYPPPSAP